MNASLSSERKTSLQFQTAIVRVFGEDGIAGSGRLIGHAEQWRRHIANDGTRIVVVGQIANLHRDRQAITAAGAGGAARPTAHRERSIRGSTRCIGASAYGSAAGRHDRAAFTRSSKHERAADAEVEHDLSGSAAEIARQYLLHGRWIWVEQAIGSPHN